MESREGQVELLKEVFERSIANEEYEALLEFIDATRVKVKSKDYDSSEVRVDDSELGKMLIKGLLNDLDRN